VVSSGLSREVVDLIGTGIRSRRVRRGVLMRIHGGLQRNDEQDFLACS
jgi:hypothetical protein